MFQTQAESIQPHSMNVDVLEAKVASVEDTLGAAFFSAPGIRLFHGDCIDFLSTLTDAGFSEFNLTATSPPYNIGKEYENEMSVSAYIDWCEQWIRQIFDVTEKYGALWLNLGYLKGHHQAKALPIPYLLWDKVPFYLLQEIVWNYGAGVAARKTFSPRNEKFLWYVKDPRSYTFNLDDIRDPDIQYPNSKKNGRLRFNPRGKNPTDVWRIPKVTSGANRSSKERTAHPTQFPVAVIERIVLGCSNPGDLVLDPFVGSGTVAEVCLRTGRACIGIDIEQKYLDMAANRLMRTIERSPRLV